jgi:ribosomal protein S27AE
MFEKLCPKCGFRLTASRLSKTHKYGVQPLSDTRHRYCPQCSQQVKIDINAKWAIGVNCPLIAVCIAVQLLKIDNPMWLLMPSALLSIFGSLYVVARAQLVKA